jgi:hypothetical protein
MTSEEVGWVKFGDQRERRVAQSVVNQNRHFFIGEIKNVTHIYVNGLLHPPYKTIWDKVKGDVEENEIL